MADITGRPVEGSLRTSVWALVAGFAGAMAVLATAMVAARLAGGTVADVTVDPIGSELQSFARGRLAGLVSKIGVILWMASAAIAFFGAAVVRPGHRRTMLLLLGAVSVVVGIDDQFLVHEFISEHLRGGDEIVGLLYLIAGAAFAYLGRRLFVERYGIVLIAAGAALATSLLLDAFSGGTAASLETAIEDSFKFLGIVWWCTYVVLRARASVLAEMPSPGASPLAGLPTVDPADLSSIPAAERLDSGELAVIEEDPLATGVARKRRREGRGLGFEQPI